MVEMTRREKEKAGKVHKPSKRDAVNSYTPVGLANRTRGDRARRRWGSDQLCSELIVTALSLTRLHA